MVRKFDKSLDNLMAGTIAVSAAHKRYLERMWKKNADEIAHNQESKRIKNQRVDVGQVWREVDIRCVNPTFEIIGIEGNYAKTLRGGRHLKVRLDRFKQGSRGYMLVKNG